MGVGRERQWVRERKEAVNWERGSVGGGEADRARDRETRQKHDNKEHTVC